MAPVSSLDLHLRELVEECSAELPEVSTRRMFGSEAFFARGTIYAVIWDGRVAVKIRDDARRAALMSLEGAEPWSPTGAKMGAWVLVPESMHDDIEALRGWVEESHRSAFAAPEKKAVVKEVPARLGSAKPGKPTKKRLAAAKRKRPRSSR